MDDYPRTLMEFDERFATEQACREYLFRLRWPDGFRCPRCGSEKGWLTQRGLVLCHRCGYQASLTAGTLFEGTRKPLRLWFKAMWLVTSQKNGASAMTLQRVLGLGSYQTAWTWLHKLRRAMVRPGRDRLAGRVEVDETYVGGEEEGAYGRGAENKALVLIAAEEDGPGIGRIRMRRVLEPTRATLHAFIREAVEPGSIVHTDGWHAYKGLAEKGYRHEVTLLKGQPEMASKLLPRVHRVASLVKRWLIGTHQGAVRPEHLDYYLDEFCFRFNRRKARHRGHLFQRLLEQAVSMEPVPFKVLVHPGSIRRIADPNI